MDKVDWTSKKTSIGRWSSFGPYYAMFPVSFAANVIERFCPPGGSVLDPFCGRGTAPFVAMTTGRTGLGIDLNEIAWIYSAVKVAPWPQKSALLTRLWEVQCEIRRDDQEPENEFQRWAFHPTTLAFLNTARRELDWRSSSLDRTLMGFILVYLHGKLGDALSNQMRQPKSMAPDYAVKWWRNRDMKPPLVEPVPFLSQRIEWRYKYGTPNTSGDAEIRLGRAEEVLSGLQNRCFDLVFTSPPYYSVTNYRYDQWIRWWAMGGPAHPDGSTKERYENKSAYRKMLDTVFRRCRSLSSENSIIYVRTDAREFTLRVTVNAIRASWGKHILAIQKDAFKRPTQTALFGDKTLKPGEADVLAIPDASMLPDGFKTFDYMEYAET